MIRVAYFTHEYNVVNGSTRSLYNMLHALREDVKPLLIFPKDGSTVELFRAEGYDCEIVPFVTCHLQNDKFLLLRRIKYAITDQYIKRVSIKRLKYLFTKYQVQLVHTNTSVISIGYEISKIMKIPHVWHIREFIDEDFNCYPIYGFDNLLRKIYMSQATISISKAVLSHFKLNDRPNAFQIYNAVISDQDIGIDFNKEQFFMLAGHLIPQKGVKEAIEAFSLFTKEYSLEKYNLVLIGEIEPSYKQELSRVIQRLQIVDRVRFIDYTNHLEEYYRKATAFLMCSKMEGLGRVTIEAMNYGCPVIGYNSGGTTEIIKNGENGFLFNNLKECADMMYKICNPKTRNSIINSARLFVKNIFTEGKYRSNIINVYKTLLN